MSLTWKTNFLNLKFKYCQTYLLVQIAAYVGLPDID